jgi:hypothetical protein
MFETFAGPEVFDDEADLAFVAGDERFEAGLELGGGGVWRLAERGGGEEE